MKPGRDREEETLDDLLKGRLKIHQKSGGFKYAVDSLLLAHFASESITGKAKGSISALDLGSGTGVLPLILALNGSVAYVAGIEIVGEMVEMGRRSVSINGLDDKISLYEGDLRDPPPDLRGRKFDLVVSNPPYRRKGSGRINPDDRKAVARHELTLTLDELLVATSAFLKPKARACFIYGAARSADMLCGLRDVRVEPSRIRFVHSRFDDPARMILVEARKGGGREAKIEKPLVVYANDGEYSPEAERIFAGPDYDRPSRQ